jgi:hypothetical protein
MRVASRDFDVVIVEDNLPVRSLPVVDMTPPLERFGQNAADR